MSPMSDVLLSLTASAPDCGCQLTASVEGSAHWSGVLGMEGVMTGDGRYIERNALYWDDLPLPIRYVASDIGAHDGAQVVGRITNIWRGENGEIMGEGDFDLDSEHGKEAMRQVAENLTNGVSMDLDDVSFEVRMSSELVSLMEAEGVAPDDEALADDEGRIKVAAVKSDDEVRITTSGRIRAATIVAIPAFAEAKIALAAGGTVERFGYNPKQARAPKGTERGGQWIDTPGGIAAMSSSLTPQEHAGRTTAALNSAGLLNGGWENAGGPHSVRPYTDADGKPRLLYLKYDEGAGDGADSWYVTDVPEGEFGPDFANPGTYSNPDSLENTIAFIQENFPDVYSSSVQTFADPDPAPAQEPVQSGEEAGQVSIDVAPLLDQPPCPVEVMAAFNALARTEGMEFASEEYMACAEYARDLLAQAVDQGYEKAQVAVDALDKFFAVDWSMYMPPDTEQPDLAEPGMEQPLPVEETLLASAVTAPPTAWFRDPKLTGPTPLTVTDDGRVYGHLAVWDTCHIGHAHSGCVKPPRSNANYAYFRVGATLTSDGTEVATGRITLETRHALGTLNATQTLAHYEDTGKAVADVAAGEDRHGIWIAGALRPGVTDKQIRALRGSPLSGDWRRIAGNLELVAALAVNVPGFPIPRPSGLVAGGAVQSLVASGMVPPRKVTPPGQPGALSAEDLRYLKRLAARERQAALSEAEQMRQKVQLSVLAMKRKTFALSNTGGA